MLRKRFVRSTARGRGAFRGALLSLLLTVMFILLLVLSQGISEDIGVVIGKDVVDSRVVGYAGRIICDESEKGVKLRRRRRLLLLLRSAIVMDSLFGVLLLRLRLVGLLGLDVR